MTTGRRRAAWLFLGTTALCGGSYGLGRLQQRRAAAVGLAAIEQQLDLILDSRGHLVPPKLP